MEGPDCGRETMSEQIVALHFEPGLSPEVLDRTQFTSKCTLALKEHHLMSSPVPAALIRNLFCHCIFGETIELNPLRGDLWGRKQCSTTSKGSCKWISDGCCLGQRDEFTL